jgi:hypothetical protein
MLKKIVGFLVIMELFNYGLYKVAASTDLLDEDSFTNMEFHTYEDTELEYQQIGGTFGDTVHLWGWKKGPMANDTLVVRLDGNFKLENGEVVELTPEEDDLFGSH